VAFMILPFIFGWPQVGCRFAKKGFNYFKKARGPGTLKMKQMKQKKNKKGIALIYHLDKTSLLL